MEQKLSPLFADCPLIREFTVHSVSLGCNILRDYYLHKTLHQHFHNLRCRTMNEIKKKNFTKSDFVLERYDPVITFKGENFR